MDEISEQGYSFLFCEIRGVEVLNLDADDEGREFIEDDTEEDENVEKLLIFA